MLAAQNMEDMGFIPKLSRTITRDEWYTLLAKERSTDTSAVVSCLAEGEGRRGTLNII